MTSETWRRCFLSKIYVKPQLLVWRCTANSRCFLSKIYVKPQLCAYIQEGEGGVSYQKSTSNHNYAVKSCSLSMVFLIKNLRQTTTVGRLNVTRYLVFLIKNLRQTTTAGICSGRQERCFLSKIYVKPQLDEGKLLNSQGVSYQKSTSNHNYPRGAENRRGGVSYQKSTSNHN